MLADSLNGEPLPPKHGGPLRLVVPKQLGYKSVKWVERIELSDTVATGYWEAQRLPGGRTDPRRVTRVVLSRAGRTATGRGQLRRPPRS